MSSLVQKDFAQAIKLLLDNGVHLITWGDQVLKSHGYPALVMVYDFIVPDARIEDCARLLLKTGLLQVEPNISLRGRGVFGTEGYLFVSPHDTNRWPTILHLLSESLVHLNHRDTDPVPSPFDPTSILYRPRLPEHCISLVRCLEDYPPSTLNRREPERYLLTLILVGLYHEKEFDKMWDPEEEMESEEKFQAKQLSAVKEVEDWSLDDQDEAYRSAVVDILHSGTRSFASHSKSKLYLKV